MHIMYSLQPGGMEFGVVKLVNGLEPARVRSVVCSTVPGGALKALIKPHVAVHELQRRQGNDLGLVWRLYRLVRDIKPHVVHTHAWGTLLEGLLASKLARVPVVVHGEHGTMQLKAYQRLLQRMGWSGVDQVLSVSSRLAERMALETGFPAARIETIRNGVDLSRFGHVDRGTARRTLGLPDDGVIVGSVGRLVPVKDQRSLIDAVGILQRRGVRVTAVLAGDGPLRDQLVKQVAELGVDVRLLGHRPDVETVLAALDVFVLSSVSEGLSNTILEAMASGVPVVATRVGGAEELIEEGATGALVPAGAPDALAHAIGELALNRERRVSMGEAARRRVEREFDLAAMIRRYESLYQRLAGALGSERAA